MCIRCEPSTFFWAIGEKMVLQLSGVSSLHHVKLHSGKRSGEDLLWHDTKAAYSVHVSLHCFIESLLGFCLFFPGILKRCEYYVKQCLISTIAVSIQSAAVKILPNSGSDFSVELQGTGEEMQTTIYANKNPKIQIQGLLWRSTRNCF